MESLMRIAFYKRQNCFQIFPLGRGQFSVFRKKGILPGLFQTVNPVENSSRLPIRLELLAQFLLSENSCSANAAFPTLLLIELDSENQFHTAMLCIVKMLSCRTISQAVVQLRKLVGAGEIPDTAYVLYRSNLFVENVRPF